MHIKSWTIKFSHLSVTSLLHFFYLMFSLSLHLDTWSYLDKPRLLQAVKSETSGKLELALLSILGCAKNPYKYFAKVLQFAAPIPSFWTLLHRNYNLIYLIICRCWTKLWKGWVLMIRNLSGSSWQGLRSICNTLRLNTWRNTGRH